MLVLMKGCQRVDTTQTAVSLAPPADVRKVFDLPEHTKVSGATPHNDGRSPNSFEVLTVGQATTAHQTAEPRSSLLLRDFAWLVY